jgi:sporulation protein YlmC with PRC-barrel domain
MTARELHVEQLLGKKVRDVDGQIVGRLEEFHLEVVDDEHVVTEFLLGPAAAVRRVGVFLTQLPLFRFIPMRKKEYCISWTLIDFSDPDRPSVRARRDDLKRV